MIDKLIVVAHPDDETIFAGREMLKEKGWKVVCVTNGDNAERRKEFQRVMEAAEVDVFEIWDYKDEWQGDFDRSRLKVDLLRILNEREYIKVLTHNKHGEYGHTQHALLGQIISSLVEKNLYVFGVNNKLINIFYLIRKCLLLRFYKNQRHVVMSKEVRSYILCEACSRVK